MKIVLRIFLIRFYFFAFILFTSFCLRHTAFESFCLSNAENIENLTIIKETCGKHSSEDQILMF
jgi:uncharacterized iron-regulated protein